MDIIYTHKVSKQKNLFFLLMTLFFFLLNILTIYTGIPYAGELNLSFIKSNFIFAPMFLLFLGLLWISLNKRKNCYIKWTDKFIEYKLSKETNPTIIYLNNVYDININEHEIIFSLNNKSKLKFKVDDFKGEDLKKLEKTLIKQKK